MGGSFEPNHVPEEWFEQYVLGTLSEEHAEILESRLLVDENCRLKLDLTETYVQAMRAALRRAQTELAAPARGAWHWRSWLSRPLPLAAAGLALATLIVIVVLLNRPVDTLGPISETVALDAARGGPAGASAHAGHLRLRLDLRGIPERSAHTVQVVTELGAEVWSAPLRNVTDYATVDVRHKLAPGDYLVRVNAGAEQLREFHLAVL